MPCRESRSTYSLCQQDSGQHCLRHELTGASLDAMAAVFCTPHPHTTYAHTSHQQHWVPVSSPPALFDCLAQGKVDKAGQPVNLWTNFSDYGLAAPAGLIRADAHTMPFR